MNFIIEINDVTNNNINKKYLKNVAETVLKEEGAKESNLSIAFVGKDKIKELNKKYRQKDEATDILSFGSILKNKPFYFFAEQRNFYDRLEEIIICPEIVKKNARQYNSTFKEELIRVLIHGILHLLGYDHEKSKKMAEEMRKKENYYFSKIENL